MELDNSPGKHLNPITLSLLAVLLATIGLLLYFRKIDLSVASIGTIISFLLAFSIKIADQWEKAVVLRLGKFVGLRGPGYFLIIPIIDRIPIFIDQRTRVTEFRAEQTLTKDTVPVNVDAVAYWMVWDAEKAALEVQDYMMAVSYIAQIGLRDTIGKHELADLLQDREKIAEDLQRSLDEHTNPWGVTC